MRSAIYDLLYCKKGNVDTIKLSEEYNEAYNDFYDCYNKLEATLNDEQKKTLNHLIYLDGLVVSEIEITFYEEGFKMASRLLCDALK